MIVWSSSLCVPNQAVVLHVLMTNTKSLFISWPDFPLVYDNVGCGFNRWQTADGPRANAKARQVGFRLVTLKGGNGFLQVRWLKCF